MTKYAELLEKIAAFEVLSKAKRVWGPYYHKSGREFVIVEDENGKKRTTTLAKHILEEHLGRELDKELETVDHIDSNFLNNDINNLQIVPRKEHSTNDTRRVKLVDLKCDLCKKDFQRSPRLLRDKHNKGASGVFCSRECSGKYNRLLQLGKIDKLPTQPFFESEYYKKKYAASTLQMAEAVIKKLHKQLPNILKDYPEADGWKTIGGSAEPISNDFDLGFRFIVLISFKSWASVYIFTDGKVEVKGTDRFPQELIDAIKHAAEIIKNEYAYKLALADYLLEKYGIAD